MNILDKMFKRATPEEQVKSWRRQLNSEMRKIDTQIRKIQREEMKVKQAAKQAVRQGDTVAVRMLSKEIIRSRNAVRRMYTARTQMNSVSMHLQQQVSQIKLAGNLKQSTTVMSQMNELVHVREVQEVMQAMGKEMVKAGLIEEMLNDTIDDALDDGISDTELEDEVSKVVEEVTQGKMQGATIGRSKLPQAQQVVQTTTEAEVEEEDGDLMERYNALRGGTS